MSDTIVKKIKQLENQNEKFKKLLEATLQLTREDCNKCPELQYEAIFLRKVVSDLENQKKQLEHDLTQYLDKEVSRSEINIEIINIQNKLNRTLNDIEERSNEIFQLETADENLKQLIMDLENEKNRLLEDINLVKKANEDNKALAQENIRLRQELAILQAQQVTGALAPFGSGQDLIKQLANIEHKKQKLQDEIDIANATSDPLGIGIENTVLELKISGLEKQKEGIIRNLRTSLLESANEIGKLHSNTSDFQLRGLLNELDIHKTILLMNLRDVKNIHDSVDRHKQNTDLQGNKDKISIKEENSVFEEASLKDKDEKENSVSEDMAYIENDEDSQTLKETASSDTLMEKDDLETSIHHKIDVKQYLSSNDDVKKLQPAVYVATYISEVVDKVTEIKESENSSEGSVLNKTSSSNYSLARESHDLPTVCEEDEALNLIAEQEQLRQEISRLEQDRNGLIRQIEIVQTQEINLRNSNVDPSNELHLTFMRERSSDDISKLPLDDATNQMYQNEEQLLEQRIRELGEDNERMRTALNLMLTDSQSDKEDTEVLEEGERLVKELDTTGGEGSDAKK